MQELSNNFGRCDGNNDMKICNRNKGSFDLRLQIFFENVNKNLHGLEEDPG